MTISNNYIKTNINNIIYNLNNNSLLKLIIYSIDYFPGLEENIIYNRKLKYKDFLI